MANESDTNTSDDHLDGDAYDTVHVEITDGMTDAEIEEKVSDAMEEYENDLFDEVFGKPVKKTTIRYP